MDSLRTLRRGAVRRVALARLISLAGTDASGVALGFAMYAQTRSASWLAASLLITIGLSSVLAPLGGWVGDRFDRKRVMVATELAAAAVFLALFFVHTPEMLIGLSVVATALGAIFGPAAGAALPELAGEDELSRANSLMAMGSNIGKTAGRLGAGILIALGGPGAVFLADAVSFVASAMLVASVRLPFGRPRAAADRVKGGVRLGFSLLARQPVLRAVTLSACVGTLMTSFAMTAEVPLVHELGAGAIGLGALTACWTLGMIAGSWHAGRALHKGNEVTGVLTGRLIMGVGLALVGLTSWFGATLACYLFAGLGAGFMGVGAQSLVQRGAPEELRARTLAAVDACRNLAFAGGVIAAGLLVDTLGPGTTFLMVGIGVLLGTAPLAALVRSLGGLRPLRPAEAGA